MPINDTPVNGKIISIAEPSESSKSFDFTERTFDPEMLSKGKKPSVSLELGRFSWWVRQTLWFDDDGSGDGHQPS